MLDTMKSVCYYREVTMKGTTMTLKEYGENAEIVYNLSVVVNDEDAIDLSSATEEGLLEQLRKVDHAIAKKLQEQFEDLPENQVNEDD